MAGKLLQLQEFTQTIQISKHVIKKKSVTERDIKVETNDDDDDDEDEEEEEGAVV